ncbi:hypothetical protein FACS1894217_07540 [Clostridia bacterium]|nr:hypothetical protein FACS1894217_07540 [Clostridia bacterium]
MLKSMTGYGRASASVEDCDFTVEIRSVNHRYMDCAVRVPRLFVYLEDAVKSQVTRRLSRGKVDVFIAAELRENVAVTMNEPLARAYYDALTGMKREFHLEAPTLGLLARMPDVFSVKRGEFDEDAVKFAVEAMVDTALGELERLRIREGERLCTAMLAQIDAIGLIADKVEERAEQVVPEYRAKLETRLRDTLSSLSIAADEPRILMETALFADKIANNEEVVRLRSHLTELRRLLESDTAQGRKADFLIQELNREANTIGSKANDVALAHIAVDLKAELEKIREQAQNLE